MEIAVVSASVTVMRSMAPPRAVLMAEPGRDEASLSGAERLERHMAVGFAAPLLRSMPPPPQLHRPPVPPPQPPQLPPPPAAGAASARRMRQDIPFEGVASDGRLQQGRAPVGVPP
mmetsp:Transcript_106118/g.331937  ORF Transcript_106118/g.331937 Transcript_106118/m.331937 type:complete len:116 (+) Transcript_106118:701-1048(+)